MNWLFYVLLIFVAACMVMGARRGFFRTAVSMVFMILVLLVTSWINPYVGKFLRENTPIYETIQSQSQKVISNYIEKEDEESKVDIPVIRQVALLEDAPLPKALRQHLLQNNNAEIYKLLGVNKFVDYMASYVAYGITNGIGFLLSYALATIIIKIILYVIDILTAIPGISFINTVGGLLLGAVQGILWIWIFFVIVTVLCNTPVGQVLMKAIEENLILSYLYDKNLLLRVIMGIMQGK